MLADAVRVKAMHEKELSDASAAMKADDAAKDAAHAAGREDLSVSPRRGLTTPHRVTNFPTALIFIVLATGCVSEEILGGLRFET